MINHKANRPITAVLTLALLLATGNVLAAGDKPMKPELAAKKEMVRSQREQRPSEAKRKTAAEALKAERLKVHQAKQHVKQSTKENQGHMAPGTQQHNSAR